MSVTHSIWPYVLGIVLIAVMLRLLVEQINRPARRRTRSPALYRPNFDFDHDSAAELDLALHDTTGQPEPD